MYKLQEKKPNQGQTKGTVLVAFLGHKNRPLGFFGKQKSSKPFLPVLLVRFHFGWFLFCPFLHEQEEIRNHLR
jgi:hypothetical protein